jgi:hypothetical protein
MLGTDNTVDQRIAMSQLHVTHTLYHCRREMRLMIELEEWPEIGSLGQRACEEVLYTHLELF